MTFADSLWVSLMGFAIVFVVLIALILLIKLLSVIVNRGVRKPVTVAPPAPMHAVPPPPPPVQTVTVPAPGSSGEVKLHTVDDKTAAMLMAIVADEFDAPLNELRFISIREVKA